MRKVATIAAALCGATMAQAAEPAANGPRIFEDYGNFTGAKQDDHGIVWISLWDSYVRYQTVPARGAETEELVRLIRRADEGGRAVRLRYDAGRGRLNSATGTLDYPLCSLILDDMRFEPHQRCGSDAPPQPSNVAAALALARAQMSVGDSEAAQKLLTRFELPQDMAARKLLLHIRAENQTELATMQTPASRAADEATVGALADYRTLAALEPDDVEHQYEVAGALLDLGAYPEARAVYENILKHWPNEDYRVAVRIGAVYRAQGNYEKALQSLNDLVARNGPQTGMKFHYHRGWTLSLLGRFDEAIRELSEGIEEQPDYSSAYLRRACAYASVGQLKEALADTAEAVRLLDLIPGAATMKPIRDDKEQIASMQAKLRSAIAAGDNKPVTGTCSGPTWQASEHPRPRSPLLPAS